jgi:hypothetical protein
MATAPEDDQVVAESADDDDSDVVDTEDGGAIVQLEKDDAIPTADSDDFYANLVETLPAEEVSALETELWKKIEFDKESRKKRDEQYEEGIRRTGLGDDAPGGAKFTGASKVVHPMLVKGCIDFASRTVKEFMPKGGIVKSYIPGTTTKKRFEKADRKAAYMNWQCMRQMKNLRNEMEQGATQAPLGGAFYLRTVYDEQMKRPIPMMVPIDDVLLPYAASSFYSAERITYVEHITEYEFERRINSGRYLDAELRPPPQPPEQSDAARANDKVEGKEADPYNEDGLRDVFEVQVTLELTDDEVNDDDSGFAPYLVTIDEYTRKCVEIVRNWEKDDKKREPMSWMVEFGFIPWRGAYPIGLTHIIGGLSAAATGALRALMDAALINNMPAMLKFKGVGIAGQNASPAPTEITEIQGPPGMDDIRKVLMPMPYNPPSMVLFQLLGFLVEQGEDVVKVALESLTENPGQQLPVGTTLALIEQGMKVLSAIHSRWHYAFQQFLEILHRIDRMYLTDEEVLDETGELMCYRSDFQGPMDVIPVSDPEIFTEVQRIAQLQIIMQRSSTPGISQLYDLHKVEKLVLAYTKIPDALSLLNPAPEIEEMNAVNENVAMALGRPVHAYPDQDHLAHIQVLVDFMNNPMLGQNSIIASTYLNPAITHLKEHMVMWYADFMQKQATAAIQKAGAPENIGIAQLLQYKDPETRQQADKLLAGVSGASMASAVQAAFKKLPPAIQAAQKMLQGFQQAQAQAAAAAQNPQVQGKIQAATIAAQAKAQETQADQAQDQAENQLKQQQMQQDAQAAAASQQAEQARTATETQSDMANTQVEQQGEGQRTAAEIQSKELINAADNQTALEIQQANAASHAASNVTTGTAVGKERPGE